MADDREGGSSVHRKSWVHGDGSEGRKKGKREKAGAGAGTRQSRLSWPKEERGV